MTVDTRVEPLAGPLPGIAWHWDPETDILSGGFHVDEGAGGLDGSVELADDEGSVAVVDVAQGVVCGLDVVVWPEVHVVPELAPPDASAGRVVVPARSSRPGIASLEVDSTLSLATNHDESVFHLRIGTRREVAPVRVADHLIVELDHKRRLAGFWLTAVPPFVPT
jgi:hypothetical protein